MHQPSIFRARRVLGLLTVVGLAVGVAACAAGGEADTTSGSGGSGGSSGTGGGAGADGGEADGSGGGGQAGTGGQGGGGGEGGLDASLDGDGAAGSGGAAGDASIDGDDDGAAGSSGSDAGDASDASDDVADGSDDASDACTSCSCKVEICNGLDDNCNGQKDEGNPGGGAACDTGKLGVCQAGTETCVNGTIKCIQNVAPSTEVCDGIDNNCDGNVDESDPNSNAPCSTGLAGICASGSKKCVGGAMTCTPNFQPGQIAEVCNGLDDNCDGNTDEGNPGSGSLCQVAGFPANSVCAQGVTQCINGQLSCPQVNQPASETCDGKDNDCNGTIDDPLSVTGQPCSTGLAGICATGTSTCAGGVAGCTAPAAQTEICNGKDDNCNGQTDEMNPNTACGSQVPGAGHVSQWACNAGNCELTKCNAGYADIDGASGNGCECASDNWANDCTSASSISVPSGGSADMTGVVESASGSDWVTFSFTVPAGYSAYHPKVQLIDSGSNQYAMDVLAACASAMACAPDGTTVAEGGTNITLWEMTFGPGYGSTPTDTWPRQAAVKVRVYRRNGDAPTCTQYKVTASNL